MEWTGPGPKILWLVFGSRFNIPISLEVTFHILALLPFSGSLRVIMLFSKSMSVHSSRFASPDRIAVSFRSCRKGDIFGPEPEIKASSSSSRGMKGNVRVILYLGFSQVPPFNLRNCV